LRTRRGSPLRAVEDHLHEPAVVGRRRENAPVAAHADAILTISAVSPADHRPFGARDVPPAEQSR
jgi:hypothetical protein